MQVSWFLFHWAEIAPTQPRHVFYSFMLKQCTLIAYLSLLSPWSQGIPYPRVVNKVTYVSMNYFLFPLTGSGIHYLLNTILTILVSEVGSWTVLLLLGCSQWCFHLSRERKKTRKYNKCVFTSFLYVSHSCCIYRIAQGHTASWATCGSQRAPVWFQAGDAFHDQGLYSCNPQLSQRGSELKELLKLR